MKLVDYARVIALVVGMAGCARVAFVVDPAFSPSEDMELARAAREWNALTKPDHRIVLTGGAWSVVKQAPADGYNGYTMGHEVEIAPGTPGASVYAVAKHEFGHALGLGHVCRGPLDMPRATVPQCDVDGGGVGVMDPMNVVTVFSPLDIAECRRVGACP